MLTREDSRAEENRGTEVERRGADRGGLHCMIFSFSLSLSLSVSFSLFLSIDAICTCPYTYMLHLIQGLLSSVFASYEQRYVYRVLTTRVFRK